MKKLIQFFKNKFGYRDSNNPTLQAIGLPVKYKGEHYLLFPFVADPTIHKYCFMDNYEYLKDRYSIQGISSFNANDLYYDFAYIGVENNNQQVLRIIDIPKICTVKPREECGHLNYNLFFKEIELVWCLGYYDDNASGTFSVSRKAFWEFSLFCACEEKNN